MPRMTRKGLSMHKLMSSITDCKFQISNWLNSVAVIIKKYCSCVLTPLLITQTDSNINVRVIIPQLLTYIPLCDCSALFAFTFRSNTQHIFIFIIIKRCCCCCLTYSFICWCLSDKWCMSALNALSQQNAISDGILLSHRVSQQPRKSRVKSIEMLI